MSIRITGGRFKGRYIESPFNNSTRPSSSMLREALFNILYSVEGFSVLDLYAGSGIIGIEAVSRGATKLTAIENDAKQISLISQAYQNLGIHESCKALKSNVLVYTESLKENFDLIYADPPFTKDYPVLSFLQEHLCDRGSLVLECPSRSIPPWGKSLKQKRYGESTLLFLSKTL